jgi:nucleoside-diphosphate-sugar epimerase
MTSTKTVLVIGANGGVGRETALAFARRGWRVRAFARRPEPGALPGADWISGDAMNAGDVAEAARGASVIVHAVNPPGYRDWNRLVLPMIDNTVAAAKAEGARIVLPGTVYNYGPDAFPSLSETDPQNPPTRKGRIRVELERRLERAARDGARVLILRAGDFYGPHMTGNSWFSSALAKPGRPVTSLTYPGRPEVGHAWAYLPDFAETAARLVEHEDRLADFDTFHFEGHWFERGVEIAERARAVANAKDAPIKTLPWTAIVALSPVVRMFRELAEMRHLWTTPIRLDNAKLVALIGEEPRTDVDAALRATLAGMGCLPGDAGRQDPVFRLATAAS